MKKALILLISILLIHSAYSQAEPIYSSKWLDLELNLNSYITLVPESANYAIENVAINLSFIPLETWRQDVLSIEASPSAEIHDDFIVYTWRNPTQLKIDFGLKSRIRTLNDFYKIRSKIRFPLESIPPEFIIYTKPTKNVDSDHHSIIQKANELAAGEDDLFVVAHKLAEYTHQQIEYNLSTVLVKASFPASWVLQNRKGVCDEITVLFMAMARALGIPARFVSGIAYTDSELFEDNWGPHGWAEVYFPGHGWVPFDVTYDQLGFIDASHITSKVSLDPDKSSMHYQWRGKNIELETSELKSDVRITEFGNKLDELVKLVVLPIKSQAGFGSYNLIEVQIENLKDYYVTTTVYLSRTTDLSVIEPYARPVLLKPEQKKKVFWTVRVNPGLDPDYVYTFPIHASTIRNTTVKTEFTSKRGDPMFDYNEIKTIMVSRQREDEKEVSRDIILSCEPDKEEYFADSRAMIYCTVENKGNFPVENLEVCLKDFCEVINVGIGAQKVFNFVTETKGSGRAEIFLTANNNDISKSTSVSFDVLDDPLISISDIEHTSSAEYGIPFEVSFMLKKESFSDPQNVNVVLMQNKLPQKWDIEELTKDRRMVISFGGTELSMKNQFDIIVNYEDKKGNSYTSADSFTIELSNVSAGQRIIIFFRDIMRGIERIFR